MNSGQRNRLLDSAKVQSSAAWQAIKSIMPRFSKWFGFSVVVSAIPLIFTVATAYIEGVPEAFPNMTLAGYMKLAATARGELFLLSAGLSAGAIGELLGSETKYKTARFILGATSVCVVLLSGALYAYVSEAYRTTLSKLLSMGQKQQVAGERVKEIAGVLSSGEADRISNLSATIFLAAAVVSGMVIIFFVEGERQAATEIAEAEDANVR